MPERVVILSGNAVPLLTAVDALDRVVARGGDFSAEIYDRATRDAVEAIPVLSEEKGETGGVVLSLEVLLEIFDATEAAVATVEDLRERVDAVETAASPAPGEERSVAMLYINESGGGSARTATAGSCRTKSRSRG